MKLWPVRASDTTCLLALLLVFCTGGCAPESAGPLCFPVTGTVTLDGRPLAEAIVLLVPIDIDPEAANAPRPMGITGADGSFALTTQLPHDGAPSGEYIVTVELRDKRLDGDELIRDGKNLLPDRYRDPAKSPFKFGVHESENTIPTLNLTTK